MLVHTPTRRHVSTRQQSSDRDRVSSFTASHPQRLAQPSQTGCQRLLCCQGDRPGRFKKRRSLAVSPNQHPPPNLDLQHKWWLKATPPIAMRAIHVSATMPLTPRALNPTCPFSLNIPSLCTSNPTHAATPPVQETEASANASFRATPLTPSRSTGAHGPRLRDEDVHSHRDVCLRMREGRDA
jgi:hypothetical protein